MPRCRAAHHRSRGISPWPDVGRLVDALAADATLVDPTGDIYLVGEEAIVASEAKYAEGAADEVDVTGANLSTDSIETHADLPGLEMSTSLDASVLRGLDVDTFRDEQIVSWVQWSNTEWLDFHVIGCFAADHCPALQDTVDALGFYPALELRRAAWDAGFEIE